VTPAERAQEPPRRRRLLWLLLAAAISGYLLYVVGQRLDLRQLWTMAREVPPSGLAGALGLYFLLGCLRTLRFRVLLERPLPLGTLLPIVLLHNLLVRTLPLWTGEISFVTLTRSHLETKIGDSVGSLLGAKLLELLLVVVGGFTSLLLIQALFEVDRALIVAVGGGCLLACLAGLSFSGAVVGWLARRFTGGRSSLLGTIGDKLADVGDHLGRVRGARTFSAALGLTLCTYSTSLCFNLLLLRSVGVEGELPALVATISVVTLASAIPLSISGLGLVEGGWTWGLVTLAAVQVERAAGISFFLHGCQLLCALLTGAVGYLWLQGLRLAAARARR
jgi:uncharacterized membrane protein YbhN (UPF0104 family)